MVTRHADETATPERTGRGMRLLRHVIAMEGRVYTSIARAIARRPDIEPGGVGIAHHRPVLPILIVFLGLSAVEIPAIDLIVHPWPAVRIPLLVVGIWGATWMVGLLCAMFVRPHSVGGQGIRVREGLMVDVPVPWQSVASVAIVRTRTNPDVNGKNPPRIAPAATDPDRLIYAERVQGETNIEIVLLDPVSVTLPRSTPTEVAVVRLWADDPQAFLDACRPHLE